MRNQLQRRHTFSFGATDGEEPSLYKKESSHNPELDHMPANDYNCFNVVDFPLQMEAGESWAETKPEDLNAPRKVESKDFIETSPEQ